jgi:hypothetical protein
MKSARILLTCIFALFVSSSVFAQFSAGLDLAFPMGDFSNMASTGFGASLRYDASISDKLGWTASFGYESYSGKTYTVNNVAIPFGNTTNIPIAGGIKYYFQEAGNGFYGGLDISVNLLNTWQYSFNSGSGGGYNLTEANNTVVGFNPGIGYRLPNLDFALRYNSRGDFSSLGIRAAYVFGGKK